MRAVTNFENDILAGFNQSQASLQQALEEVSTGRRVNNPSDDPANAATMVRTQAESDQVDQYTSNVNTALGIAQSSDSILSSVTALLTKAVSLGTEGANGTSNAANQSAIASEIDGILQSVVSEANSTYEGAGLFTGTAGAGPAFVADASSPSGYSYQGGETSNAIQVGDSLTLEVSIPGDAVFSSSLTALKTLSTALKSGDTAAIGNATTGVSTALSGIAQFHATYGDAINQLNTQESFLSTEKLTLSQQQSNLIDADTATAAEQLAQAEAQNSAVLAAAAKIQPENLLSYLHG